MAETGSGDPRPVEVELLADGRGPEVVRGWTGRSSRVMGDRGRRVLAAAAVAALVLAVLVVTHRPAHAPVTAVAAPRPHGSSTPAPVAPAEVVELLTDQYSYSTERGSLSLLLDVVNYGATPIQVLRTRLPQAGSRPVPGPGGDLPFSSPVTLAPGQPTEVTVSARVSCPGVLTAQLADHVDVTLGVHGEPQRVLSLSLAPLGTVLDEARHQACGATSASAAIYPTMVPGSVRVGAASAGAAREILSELSVQNVGGVATTVSVAGAGPVGVTVAPVGTGRPLTLRAGRTALVPLRWDVQDCAALTAVRWPTLELSIQVATSSATDEYGFDSTFGAAWRAALTIACSH